MSKQVQITKSIMRKFQKKKDIGLSFEFISSRINEVLSAIKMQFHDAFIYGKKLYILHKGKKKQMTVYLDNQRDKLLWISSKTKAFLIDLYFTTTFSREVLQIDQLVPKQYYFGLRQLDEQIFFIFEKEEERIKYLNLFKIYCDGLKKQDPNYSIYFSNINKLHAMHSTEQGSYYHTTSQILAISEKVGLVNKKQNQEVLKTLLKLKKVQNQNQLPLACVDDYFSIQFCKRDLQPIFEDFSKDKIGDTKSDPSAILKKVMSPQQFETFLVESQKQSSQKIKNILSVYNGELSFFDFCRFLYDSKHNNLSRQQPLQQNRPLNQYFCFSSHNTYLSGNQLSSDCKAERYTQDLQDGVKCVELDVHNDGVQPIVTHAFKGKGFCKPVTFQSVIKAIQAYSIKCTIEQKPHFPLILSLQNHASNQNKEQMLHIMTKYFGKNLHYLSGNQKQFPTLKELTGKIIIKTSSKESDLFSFKKKMTVQKASSLQSSLHLIHDKKAMIFQNKQLQQRFIQFTKLKQQLQNKKFKFNIRIQQYEQVFIPISSMAKVTCIFKSDAGTKKYDQTPFVCTSQTNEKVAKDDPSELVKYTCRSWLRTYPIGTQIQSTNYNPCPMLAVGAQIIALNTQTKDDHAWMMYRYFCGGHDSNNSQRGYLLKQPSLRDSRKLNVLMNDRYQLRISIVESGGYQVKIRFKGLKEAQESFTENGKTFTFQNLEQSFVIFDIGMKFKDCVALRFIEEGYRIIQGRNSLNYNDCGIRVLIHSNLRKLPSE